MAQNDQLHQLIHSLTKNEKGYFKKVAKGMGRESQNYLRLFDAIHAQEAYDEAVLKKKNSAVKNFSMAKTYLADAILRSLRNYHAAESPEKQVEELTDNVRICITKGLYETGTAWLRKGKALAQKHDLFHQHLILLQQEFRMRRHLQVNVSDVTEEQQVVLQHLQLHQQLSLHSAQVLTLWQRFRNSRTPGEDQQIETILASCRQYDAPSLPLLLRHIARETIANCYAYKGDRKKAFEVKRETLSIYEQSPALRVMHQYRFLKLLSNVLALSAELCPLENFYALYERLPALLSAHPGYRSLKKEIEVRFRLVYLSLGENFAEAAAYGESQRSFILHAPELADGRKLEMCNLVASAYFYSRNPRMALRWVRALLDHPCIVHKAWMQRLARLMELFLFYDLGKIDLLEARLTNITRQKDYPGKYDAFEVKLYQFLKQVSNASPSEAKQEFARFREALNELAKDPRQALAIRSTDLPLWLEQHCAGS